MKIGVIGSCARNFFFPKDEKKPNDIDIVATYDDAMAYIKMLGKPRELYPIQNGEKLVAKFPGGPIVEAEIAWPGSLSEELLQLIVKDYEIYRDIFDLKTDYLYYATPPIQYMLKMSHRFKKNSPFFLKTMRDIQFFRDKGCVIKDEHQNFYQRREKATYNYSHPNLNQSKANFFDNSNDIYRYDHDSIHRAVALYDKPAYEYYKPDTNEVYTSKEMFFNQSEEIKLAGAYEEVCVLALERSQIPYPETSEKKSFLMALEKLATSISSGWFRNFVWENYDSIVRMYEERAGTENSYTEMFKRSLDAGLILPYKETEEVMA